MCGRSHFFSLTPNRTRHPLGVLLRTFFYQRRSLCPRRLRLLPATQKNPAAGRQATNHPYAPRKETMKIRLVVALIGLTISFAVPAFAQQKDTVDTQIIEQLAALEQEYDEAFNNGDAVALAATFKEDAVLVNDTGPVYGREAIGKYYAELFKQVHFSDHICKSDQYSPHIIGTAGNEIWSNREWSTTIQGQNFGPIRSKGYVSSIAVREGDVWKKRIQISNVARNYRVGLAISFAVPAFAQQKETIDPKILEQLAAFGEKTREAWNNNDAAALAATYTEDAILVHDAGPVYGREAIGKYYADLFKQVHFSNHIGKWDQYSPHIMGTAGNEIWSNGEWSLTYQVGGGGPTQLKGYWVNIQVREGDAWKTRMEMSNVAP
jgi:ketosteroid isomerase-like protein